MARPLRIDHPGGYYHVTNRGVAQQDIFFDTDDRREFLRLLRQAHDRYRIVIHGYCLMTNHYHLEVETPEGNLSRSMQWVNQKYAAHVNRRYARAGHLFQGRFKSVLVEADTQLHVLTRYIHLNPVRAGMVAHPSKYAWSSYRAYVGLIQAPAWLEIGRTLSRFGRRLAEQRRRYREFVDEGVAENPLREMRLGAVLGTKAFVAWAREKLHGRAPDCEVARLAMAQPRPTLEDICQAVAAAYDVDVAELRRKGRKRQEGRDVAVYLARELSGCSLKQIGSHFGGIQPSGVSMAHRRVAEKARSNRSFRKRVAQLSQRLTGAGE